MAELNSATNPTAELAELLRRRREASSGATSQRRKQKLFENLSGDLNNFTVGGQNIGGSIGGKPINIPVPVQVNWGDILGKFGSNYMAARSEKKADELDAEADSLNQEFFKSSLGNDPQAQKLFMMAQAGMPGADKALAEHLMPKKQSLAVLVQGMTSGKLDPSMAAEIAPQFGVEPEVARKAAEYSVLKLQRDADTKYRQQYELKMAGIDAADRRATMREERADARARLKTGGKVLYDEEGNPVYGEGGGPELTPGERQVRAKVMDRLDTELSGSEKQLQKFPELRQMLESDDTFGVKQKAAEVLAGSSNPVLGAIGTSMRSKSAVLLEDYLNSETLSRMAQLGGNDSNEELRRMRASLPTVLHNKEAALALMDQLHEWQVNTRDAIKRRRADYKTGRFFEQSGSEPNYYLEAVEARKPKIPDTLKKPEVKTQAQKPKQSIDEWLDEQEGLE